MLETVLAVKEKHKADHIAKILAGTRTLPSSHTSIINSRLLALTKRRMSGSGIMVIRQALINKLLTKDIENYGLLGLTRRTRFPGEAESFLLNEDHDYTESEDEEASFGARTAAADEELLSILKDLRKKISKQADSHLYIFPGSIP
jgi:ATP-dependent DNA helicase RecQ